MGENWESSGRRRDRNKHAVVFSQSRKRPDTFVPGAAPCSSLISEHFISVSITKEKKDGGGAKKSERERRHAATRWGASEPRVSGLTDVVEPQRRRQAGGGRVQQASEHVEDTLGRQQHPGVTHSARHGRVTPLICSAAEQMIR